MSLIIIFGCINRLIQAMKDKQGFDKGQIKEVMINAFIFSIQMIVFYLIEQNKIFTALATMAALFSLYTIPLSKSDIKSTIIGSLFVNVLMSIFFISYYFNNNNIIFIVIWILILIWFTYKLIEKFKLK